MKDWILIVMLFGEVVYSGPKMTASECTLQAAYRIQQLEQFFRSGRPVPEKYGGSRVTRKDVRIACARTGTPL